MLTDTLPFHVNAAKLHALLKKADPQRLELPEALVQRDPIAVLVHSFLLWEASSAQSLEAYRRVQEAIVDFNDLRVSLPQELIAAVGLGYPRVEERMRRLRASLNEIFKREHAVRLPQADGRRDVRAYVESLDGIVASFVAARVLLICYGVHVVPVDEQTRAMLAEEGLAEPDTELFELGAALAKAIKPEHGESAHQALQALVDQRGAPASRPARRSAVREGARKGRTARP